MKHIILEDYLGLRKFMVIEREDPIISFPYLKQFLPFAKIEKQVLPSESLVKRVDFERYDFDDELQMTIYRRIES